MNFWEVPFNICQTKCDLQIEARINTFQFLGGIETMSITEAFGEFRFNFILNNLFFPLLVCCFSFRTGKTQIAHTLCVSTQVRMSVLKC